MPFRCLYSIGTQVLFQTDLQASTIDEAMLESFKVATKFGEAWNSEHRGDHIEPAGITRTLINVGPQLPVWEITKTYTVRVAAETLTQAIAHAPKNIACWHPHDVVGVLVQPLHLNGGEESDA